MAHTFGAQNATGSATLSVSPPVATTTGDLLVATIRTRNTTALAPVTSVVDSNAADHWAPAGSAAVQGTNADGEIWYVANAASLGTGQSITVTVGGTSASTSAIAFTVLDVTGMATTSPLDATAPKSGNTQPANVGPTGTTLQASEVVISSLGWNGNGTTSSAQTAGYTVDAIHQSTVNSTAAAEQAAFQIVNATGAQSYQATLSSTTTAWTGVIATFKVSTGPPPTPTITSFAPIHGVVGATVVINGTGFTGTTAVVFNATNQPTYTVNSDIKITTTVPSGATTGAIHVTAPGGPATSSTSFTVDSPPTPTITNFSPTSGSVGTPVTITGSGYTGTTGASGVQFNGTNATYSVTDDSHISTSVPTGATTGTIKVTAPGGNVTSTATFTVTVASGPPHIMLIVEENEESTSILGNTTDAPYLNSLASTYASATQWFAVEHNSPTDYVDLLSGSNQGWPLTKQQSTANTLVDELHGKTTPIPWKAYMENLPSTCTTSTGSSPYSVIHNPFRYFANYTTSAGGWCSTANQNTEGVLPYPSGGVAAALNVANPPAFVWITPNDCNDMHGQATGCSGSTPSQLISAGDSWLNTNIAPVISSPWFAQNGIIIITWDEGTTGNGCCGLGSAGGHIATLVITSKNSGFGAFATPGDHYGTLATIEKAYGVGLLLNSATAANGDLTPAFVKTATTGSITGTVSDTQVPAQPVSGATVCYYTGSSCSGGGTTTTTNSSGVYNFASVPPGGYTVSVTAPGYTTPATQPATVTAGNTATVNFTMTATGGISGAVSDSQTPTAQPISGASVHYAGTGTTTGSGTAITTSTGGYSFSGVPSGTYSVTATATGFTPPAADPVTVLAPATATANFTMTATSGISGTVFDTQTPAKPISGAIVSYTGTNGSGSTPTDSSGAYTLSGVPAGSYTVSVAATGFTPPATQPATVTSGNVTSGVNFTMTANSGISGTVFDTQSPAQPVTGATVSYTGTAGSGSTSAINSTTGAYTLSGVPAGSYTVSVTAAGFTTPSSQPVTVATSGNTPSSVNFTMIATTGISGTVFDTQTPAQAISGATVTYSGNGGNTATATMTTNSSGAYSFAAVSPGSYAVSVTDNGFTTPPQQSVTVAAGGNTPSSVNFTMTANSGIIGGVGNGTAGIPGATVQYVATGTSTGSGSTTTGTVCSVSGCPYTFSGVPAGTYNVTASAPGYTTSPPQPVNVTAGSNTTQDFTLTLATTGSISGTVSDSQTPAQPISGAIVCYYTSVCGDVPADTTTTNSSGAYSFTGVSPGAYSVSVAATGFTSPAADSVTVIAGGNQTANFTMTAASGISGTVFDTETPAQPVTGATVSYSGTNGSGSTNVINSTTGAYTLSGVPAGTYTVSVTAPGFTSPTPQSVSVTANNTTTAVNFTMTATSGISGAVSDSQTPAQPVNGASVSYTGTGSSTGSGTTTTNSSGAYSFTGVPPGTYSVSVTAPGFTPPSSDPVTVTAGNSATANFTMTATSGISGTVTDSQTPAQPVSGATITYAGTSGTTGGGTTTTNASGVYTFNGVPAGTYSVTATKTGFTTPAADPASVTAGNTVTANFTMTATSGISGAVNDSQTPGQPVNGATVTYTATGSSTGSGTTTTTSTGGYTFTGVPPGTYSVTATKTGFTTPVADPVTVTAGNTATANFTMTATSGISGTVTDSVTHTAITTATVSYLGTGGTTGSGSTTAINSTTGAYTLSGVPAGTYTVTASATGYVSQSLTGVVVTAGNTTPNENFALTSTHQPIFADGFESGDFTKWTSSSGLTVETTNVHSGTHAAEGVGASGNALKLLPSTYTSGYERVWLNIVSETSQVKALQARTTGTGSTSNIAYILVDTSHHLALNVNGTKVATSATTVLPGTTWYELEMHVTVNGAASSIQVFLGGTQVTDLNWSGTFTVTGSNPIGQMQVGDTSGSTWDVAFDDAAFDTQFLP